MVSHTKLRCLSLFSGIGGIDLGLKRAGIAKTVCYVEIDPYAVGVLVKNMAKGYLHTAPVWDDVRTFGRTELNAIGTVDLIAGGFPCQDISCAGKGEGIQHGNRSGLFYEIIRIVRMARPKYIFLENVPALLARGMDTVLRELSESGYDVTWQTLSAAQVGANHRRERVWILAYSQSERVGGEAGNIFEKDGGSRRALPQQPVGSSKILAHTKSELERRLSFRKKKECAGFTGSSEDVSDTEKPGLERSDSTRDSCAGRFTGESESWRWQTDWWSVEPDVGRVAHGIPFRVDRLRCLGNAVVPQCVEYLFSR